MLCLRDRMFHPRLSLPPRAGAACLVALISLTAHCGAASPFAPISTYPSGGAAQYTAVADVNRDGKTDVFVSNLNGVITLLLNHGNGSFGSPLTVAHLAAGSYPIATADFNRDGKPDLAVLNPGTGKVIIYFGRGDGTFEAPKTITVGNAPNYIVIGDVNGDHVPDLLFNAASGTAAGFTILVSEGNGSFKAPVMINAVNSAAGGVLAVGDVNNDGHLDVVTSDYNGNSETFLGNGNGTFREQPIFQNGSPIGGPSQSLLADLDDDGKLDFVAGNFGFQGFQGNLSVFQGNGDGTFGSAQYYNAGFFPAYLSAADMNGDGKTDLIVGNAYSNSVSIFLNQGAGKLLSPPHNYATPYLESDLQTATPGLMSVADLNGDGKPDVAIATILGVDVLMNAGTGILNAPGSVEVFQYTGQIFADDFNHDGNSDLAVETAGIEGVIIGSVEVLNGNGKGAFSVDPFQFPEDVGLASLGGGDFDGNGHVGIAAYGYGLQGIFTTNNDGSGNFSNGPTLELPNQPYSFCAGDFNGDKYSDFAVLNGNEVDVYLNKHDGTYSGPVTYNVGANPFFIACRALRTGGRMDLITANHDSNDVSVLLGKGDGTFAPAVEYAAGTNAEAITTGDFNRDGKIDLAVGGKQQIAMLRGRGDGTFETAVSYPAPGPVTYLTEVDLRGTGIEDLISVNTDFNDFNMPDNIFLLSGKGDGTFASPVAIGAGADPYRVTAGDFNNDGTPDLVVSDYYSSALVLLLNQRGTYIGLKSSSSTVKAGQPVTVTLTLSASVPGVPEPAGTVAFKDNGKTVSIAHVASGKAEFTSKKLAAGTHHITASYWGNEAFSPHLSSAVSVKVD